MAHIALPDGLPGIRALLAFRPEIARPLVDLTQLLMTSRDGLPPADAELIGAYISSLNDCTYCHASHAAIAACLLDGDESLVASIVRDPERAPIPPKLKALLNIAAHVQQGGRHVTADDIARARAEGATDVEIHDTVLIAASFCMVNRYVDGLGTWAPTDPDSYRQRAAMTVSRGYGTALPSAASAAPPSSDSRP